MRYLEVLYLNIENFLQNVCQEIKYKPVRSSISEELEQHIQEIKEEYIQNGIEEQEAEEKAIKQMGNAEEIGKRLNKIHRPKIDWKLIVLITILTAFGIIISVLKRDITNEYEINKTLIYISIGIVVSIIIYFIDYRKIKKFSNLIYLIASFLLILPISGISDTINGVPVLDIVGDIVLIPCMIAVPMYIIAFVGFITNYNKDKKINIRLEIINKTITIENDLIKIIVLSIISLILITKIPSKTNAIILGITYLIIITIQILKNQENSKKKIKLIYSIISVLAISIIIIITMLSKPYMVDRFKSHFNPELDPSCGGYEGILQKEIIENAKLIGEANTEIISNDKLIINNRSNNAFIYLLGKTGILVSSILIITIILTSIRLIKNAKNIRDTYGKYIIIGLSSLYIIQSVTNVLMNLNLGIKTDINLPFVSYGGQYFIINLVSIAIILSIYRRKDIILEN